VKTFFSISAVLAVAASVVVVTGSTAHAAAPDASAAGLAAAMGTEAGTVTSAEYTAGFADPLWSSSATIVSETPLAGFPRAGGSFAVMSTGYANLFVEGVADTGNNDLGGPAGTDPHGPGLTDLTTLKLGVAVPVGRNCAQVDLRFFSNENPAPGAPFTDGFVFELDSTTFTVSATGYPPVSASNAVAAVTRISTGVAALDASPLANRQKATQLLTASVPITPGAHTLYFSTFDTSDFHNDSDVLLDNLRFTSVAAPATECAKGVAPAVTNTGAPTINGQAVVGGTLVAGPGAWSSTTPLGYTYQWLRGGAPIAGATTSSYQPGAADQGQPLAVRVTAGNGGSAQATSAATAPIAAGKLKTGKPKIKGTAAVGHKLKISAGKWGPGKVRLKYQWFRGAKKIKHATKKTYKPTAADVGRRLKVVVTGSLPGYQQEKVTSKATAKVSAR
jgi:hypothetical protein